MTDFFYLVPLALLLGLAGLVAFMWALSSGQYDDLDGDAERILFDDDDKPLSRDQKPATPDDNPDSGSDHEPPAAPRP